jgi:hypothetical protein
VGQKDQESARVPEETGVDGFWVQLRLYCLDANGRLCTSARFRARLLRVNDSWTKLEIMVEILVVFIRYVQMAATGEIPCFNLFVEKALLSFSGPFSAVT